MPRIESIRTESYAAAYNATNPYCYWIDGLVMGASESLSKVQYHEILWYLLIIKFIT